MIVNWWTPRLVDSNKETECCCLLRSKLGRKTDVLKQGKVIILNCIHQMTTIPIPFHASVKVRMPVRELPAQPLFSKVRMSPFQTRTNTSVQDYPQMGKHQYSCVSGQRQEWAGGHARSSKGKSWAETAPSGSARTGLDTAQSGPDRAHKRNACSSSSRHRIFLQPYPLLCKQTHHTAQNECQ